MSQPEHLGSRVRRAAAQELRRVVTERQIKLTELSSISGIPRSTLHHRLNDNGDLTVAELVQLAIALDLPAAGLVAAAIDAASDGTSDDSGTPNE
ncbi:helix-turn-helix domain-containing protein [Nocardioides immobilis]|uniref:helix-turn-helix domain-containing protein n=1 Tax=Nocardioides immobilis TaxID=2049295 RepID=UPI0015FAD90E|nr:helix-turn-helix transcriptional regulator [Nocardioides immobilis]